MKDINSNFYVSFHQIAHIVGEIVFSWKQIDNR